MCFVQYGSGLLSGDAGSCIHCNQQGRESIHQKSFISVLERFIQGGDALRTQGCVGKALTLQKPVSSLDSKDSFSRVVMFEIQTAARMPKQCLVV